MIRIVHIVPEDGIGGVEIAARSQAAATKKDHHFRLIFIAGKESHLGSLNPICHWRTLMEARRERPDVIVVSLWKSVPVAVALKMMFPRAVLIFTLNNEATTHALDAGFSRLGIAIADEVWGDSRQTLEARLGDIGKAGRVISFIVDRPVIPAPRKPGFHFVVWGRLSRQKGLDHAIRLVALLAARGIDARFDIWGPDDGERARLEHLIAAHDLGTRVHLRGPVARSELHKIAAQASFFLLPSRFEGLAMACVEAMQLGLIPVVTAVGAMADYVSPGRTGILIDPSNLDRAGDEITALVENAEQFAKVRDGAIERWQDAPLYAEDMFNACHDVYARTSRRQTSDEPKS